MVVVGPLFFFGILLAGLEVVPLTVEARVSELEDVVLVAC